GTRVHELRKNNPARCVYGLNDLAPTLNLGLCDQSRLPRIRRSVARFWKDAFAEDEAELSTGESGIVRGHPGGGDPIRGRTDSRHRGHDEAVAKLQTAKAGFL